MTEPVGSVSVDVVPNAERFWSAFREKTQTEAGRVGSELGRPLGDAMGTAAGRAARLRIEEHLRGLRADVDVNVNQHGERIRQLEQDLANLRAQLDNVRGSQSSGAQGARREVNLLMASVLALGPAIVPLGAALTGLFTGAVASGGTAVLAILGIKDAMAQGTKLGQQYKAAFAPIVDEFQRLKDIAAAGVFGGISKAIGEIKPSFHDVEFITHDLAVQLGQIAGNVGSGLVGLFRALAPLFSALGDALVLMTKHFSAWANSSGAMKGFVAYVQAEIPHVEQFLSNLMTTVGHLAQAFAPMGGVVLDALSGFSAAINAIPIGVLQVLAPLLLGLRLALLASRLRIVQAAFVGIAGAIRAFGASARAASFSSGAIIAALSVAALAYATFTGHSQAAARAQEEMKEASDQVAQAIEQDSGALGENTRAQIVNQLQQSGALELARKYHINLGLITNAMLGNTDASQKLNKQLGELAKGHRINPADLDDRSKLLLLLGEENANVEAGKHSYDVKAKAIKEATAAHKNQVTTLDDVTKATGLASDTAKDYAAMLGFVADKDKNIKGSTAGVSSAVNQVALAYQFASETGDEFLGALKTFSSSAATAADRADLIGATLKAAAGDSLNYAAQINGAAVANHELVTSIQSAAKQVGKSGESTRTYLDSIVNLKKGTIDYSKAAAQPLISGLQQIQTASINAAKAAYQHYLSTMDSKSAADQAYKVYVSQTRGALVDEFQKLGLTAGEAKKLADNYLGVPGKVKTLIEQEGGGSVTSILTQIKDVLVKIAGVWGIKVQAKVSGLEQINELRNKISYLKNFSNTEIYAAFPHAVGGIVNRPTFISPWDVAGEAGREAIVPLDRPLSQVDPSVRWLAAIAQGAPWAQPSSTSSTTAPSAAGTRTVHNAPFIGQIVTSDPLAAANEVQRRQQLAFR